MTPPLSTDFLTEFIELYRRFPCLWKIKSSEYSNKNLRQQAYDCLIDLCKTVVPDANKEYVVKKINSLRGAFRKELNKVKQKKSGSGTDENYEPKLWYFNLLLFTADQEMSRETIANDNNTEISAFNETQDEIIIDTQNEDSELSQEVLSADQESESADVRSKTTKKTNVNGKKLDKTNKKVKRDDIYMKAMKTLTKEEDEFDYFALATASKLRKMDNRQRIFCENIINCAIYKGQLGQLTENFEVCEKQAPFQQYIPQETTPNYSNNSNYSAHTYEYPSTYSTSISSVQTPSTSNQFIRLESVSNSRSFRINDLFGKSQTNDEN